VEFGIIPKNYEDKIRATLNIDEGTEIRFYDSMSPEMIRKEFSGFTITQLEARGFASSHGVVSYNKEICNRRENAIKEILQYKGVDISNVPNKDENNNTIITISDMDNPKINNIDAKIARAAYAILSLKREEKLLNDNTGQTSYSNVNLSKENYTAQSVENGSLNEMSTTFYDEQEYSYDNEYLYFSEVMGDEIIRKSIIDKVRYFDPTYHSITPEGFNARLTFLHQCTRQGPSNAVTSGRVNKESPDYLKFAGNLAFGRAPYCILRIGDFFNTKICIDSLSVNYDNNGIQWDMNPEGVGLQPMFANISISFKFLGGQDITGPIERLQNAVTANYYANASIYSRHSDSDTYYYDATTNQKINKI
jgi:hypothetical protein